MVDQSSIVHHDIFCRNDVEEVIRGEEMLDNTYHQQHPFWAVQMVNWSPWSMVSSRLCSLATIAWISHVRPLHVLQSEMKIGLVLVGTIQ
jgi:hypothetical protein